MSATAGRARPAGPRDVDRLAALFTLLVEHHAPLGIAWQPRPGADLGHAAADWLRRELETPDVAVLCWERDGDLPGLCVVRLARRPPLFVETARGAIDHLVVRPAARRAGIGRGLVAAAADWLRARGAARVEIAVARGNAEADAFWRALGFRPTMDVLDRPL